MKKKLELKKDVIVKLHSDNMQHVRGEGTNFSLCCGTNYCAETESDPANGVYCRQTAINESCQHCPTVTSFAELCPNDTEKDYSCLLTCGTQYFDCIFTNLCLN